MRLLFVKSALLWPRSSGHDVFTYFTMKACAELGHDVSLATAANPVPEALEGLRLASQHSLDSRPADPVAVNAGTRLQRRFRSFWGVPDARLAALRHIVTETRAEAVVVVGLDALPYFPALFGVVRVWFAADEWIWHHLSQVHVGDPRSWSNLRVAVIKGLYERAHTGVVDRVWVVSESERRAMRWLAGMPGVDVVPLGVDGDYYTPAAEAINDPTAAFWGRLDFGPNIQGLEWFCRTVWPLVRLATPAARLTIIGFKPGREVKTLATLPGVTLVPDVPDLRGLARRHALAVMPFVSGGGIKNKLLEAAAMGLPIVCTPTATLGLRGMEHAPFAVSADPDTMSAAIVDIWQNRARRAEMGAAARKWVLDHHSWTMTARLAMASLEPASGAIA